MQNLENTSQRKQLWVEIGLVLGVSLGASAVYSILQLLQTALSPAGIAGSTAALNQSQSSNQFFDAAFQLLDITFALVPVALAIYFLRQRESDLRIGGWPVSAKDIARAVGLAATIGLPGIALYAVARATGLAVQVVAASANNYWWTIPVLLLSALRAAVTEEVIMVGFLFRRLEQLGFSFAKRQAFSAIIRGSYHAYQGLGGAFGNIALGLAFGWCYRRWGRIAPLVIAHFILDAVVFVGFALMSKQLANLGW
jgi:hypothetical protein